MRYRLQRHDGTDCSATMVPITVLRMVPIQRYRQFGSILQNENDKFTFRRQILAGFLNYGNEVGRSEIQIIYQVGTEVRNFAFSFEVLSTKLNYHEHWKTIIEDIEQEYRMLSLDYMRRTFHGFSPDISGETPEIIWWSVFANE